MITRTGELATWYDVGLTSQLRSLESESFDTSAIGFTSDEIDLLNERIADEVLDRAPASNDGSVNDARAEWEGMPEFEQEDLGAKYSIKINFLNEADLGEFAKLLGQRLTTKTKSVWYPAQKALDHRAELIVSDES